MLSYSKTRSWCMTLIASHTKIFTMLLKASKTSGYLGLEALGEYIAGEVAVKRVSHGSRQGMKEFVAEIVSIGNLRHRNIVQLLGYYRRKGELLLVYDFMRNGSLDKFLYGRTKLGLDWAHRFRIIKGVASSLLYLHQDWEKVVIHRDIKTSNVLLDSEMNGRLGDFGLARLYDHGTDPHTTHVVGTLGFLAPELIRNGKATTATETTRALTASSRLGAQKLEDGIAARNAGAKIGSQRLFGRKEMEMVLKLGLLCSHPMPKARPSMRQVVQFLEGDTILSELPTVYMNFNSLSFVQGVGLHDHSRSVPSHATAMSTLSGGR